MNKGFSLVELIVVIAIMAILVGVAVPVYTSYIGQAESAIDEQYISELESAINTALIDIDAGLTYKDATVPDKIEISGTTVTATATVKADDGAEMSVECDDFETLLKSLITIEDIDVNVTFNSNGTVTVKAAE